MDELKHKARNAKELVSQNPTVKKILDNGLHNPLSVGLLIIAFLGFLTDPISVSFLEIEDILSGTSLSSFYIGFLLPILMLILISLTAIGFKRKPILIVSGVTAAVVVFQLALYYRFFYYELVPTYLGTHGHRNGPEPEESVSTLAIIFISISIIAFLVGAFSKKEESSLFINNS